MASREKKQYVSPRSLSAVLMTKRIVPLPTSDAMEMQVKGMESKTWASSIPGTPAGVNSVREMRGIGSAATRHDELKHKKAK